MYMYMCLSRVPVTAFVVRQRVVINDAINLLVPMDERVLSVIWHLDDISQLCVVVILVSGLDVVLQQHVAV